MDPEKWQKVKTIFEEIVDLPAAERRKQLIELTESNRELRDEVESLIEFDSDKQVVCTTAIPLAGNTSGAIVGPYRLNFPLAINEKTEVWQAVHQALPEDSSDRKVAIKFFKDLHGDERRARRFQQEAAILSRFKHPSIARFLEEGKTESGVPWFSTAYVEGLDLIAMADRQGLDLVKRLELFDQVCAALEYSHRFLVIHRDVKPGNVVVDQHGKAVLIDFGISKQLEPSPMDADQLTRTFERTLTPAYASPEQLRGEPVSAVTDVYGAGLVLYELVSGHHPYSDLVHEDDRPLFDRILFELPLPPSQTPRESRITEQPRIGVVPKDANLERQLSKTKVSTTLKLDQRLDSIVMKAIAKAPEQRYQSVADLRRDIASWRSGKPLSQNSLSVAEPSWFQRNAILCSVLACLLGVAMTLGLAGLFRNSTSGSARKLELLEDLSNANVEFGTLGKGDWKDLRPVSKLSLSDLAIRNQQFEKAIEIVSEVTADELEQAEKFKLAKQWSELGFPEIALDCAGVDPDSFETLVKQEPSFEQWRRLVCQLHLGMGLPNFARKINDSGLRVTAADRFERELTENEIREASKWFDGLDSRIESTKKQFSNPRIRERDRRDFADLLLRREATEKELRQALLELDDRPGEWSRSKAKLALAKMLLAKDANVEGQTLLLEIVREFQARDLPVHPIVMEAWIVADLFLVDELEMTKWWNQYESQIALSHPRSLELFAGVVKWERDQVRHYKTLRPWLEKSDRVENGPVKIAVLREVWRGALESNDRKGAALMIQILSKASEQYIDKNSLEYAEILIVESILRRFVGEQDVESEFGRYEIVKRICDDVIKGHDNNVTAAFLKAIDLESPDSVFKLPESSAAKCPSGWIREFIYHQANRSSDQLEMVAWFSEFHSETNSDDVRRLVEEALRHREAKDWGSKADVNWNRVEAIKSKLNREAN